MIENIPKEILKTIKEDIVFAYNIIPYERKEGVCYCYGLKDNDYLDVIPAISSLYNLEFKILALDSSDFNRILNKNYRTPKIIGIGDKNFLLKLIRDAYDNKCSDIHIECYEMRVRIRLRIDGILIERYVIERAQYMSLVNQIKIMASLDIAEKRLPQDGRILYKDGDVKFDVRVSIVPAVYGEKVVMRLLTRQPELLMINNLGLTERQLKDYMAAVRRPHGLILLSGPTGSGKSTTLYATLALLNNEGRNILTVEDPIEYTIDGVNQIQTKEDIGLTFSRALKSFLRQDPDIIMVGEIRDDKTAEIAVRSSLTGHLVLSTLHTNDAVGCLSRLAEMGISSYLLSDTVNLMAAQRLVRILCPHCKVGYEFKEGVPLYKSCGCEKCFYTGYKGRKAIYEVVPFTDKMAQAMKRGQMDLIEEVRSMKLQSLEDSALRLLYAGQTSLDEVITFINIDKI